jgi:hypothetical protein
VNMTPTDKPTQVGGLFVSDAIERLFSDAYACGLNGDPFDMLKARAIVNEAAAAYAQANVQALEARLVALEKDAAEGDYVIQQMGRLLAEIAVIVNGPQPPSTRWSYHDLPAKIRDLKESKA